MNLHATVAEQRIYAKVNLSLAVTGKRGALHTLESEMVSVSLFDEVRAELSDETSYEIDSRINGIDTVRFTELLSSAYRKFIAAYGDIRANIKVTKNIPLGAGLGGSTASVVGLVKCLAELKNVALDDGFLLSVGSDAPFMARGGRAIVGGVGEEITPLPFVPYSFVGLLPTSGVDTAKAYALYDEIGAFPFGERRNDLEFAAVTLNGEVREARKILEGAGAKDVVMSGSGSFVVAVTEDGREADRIFAALDGIKGHKAFRFDAVVR